MLMIMRLVLLLFGLPALLFFCAQEPVPNALEATRQKLAEARVEEVLEGYDEDDFMDYFVNKGTRF